MQGTRRHRRNLPHIQEEGRTFFVTFRVRTGTRLSPEVRYIVLDCCKAAHKRSAFLHCAAVMPDHVHLILTPLQDDEGQTFSLSTILRGIKGVSAREANKLLGCNGSLWQDESFDHMLRHNESIADKRDYVLENPVRKGLSKTAAEYPWLWRASQEH